MSKNLTTLIFIRHAQSTAKERGVVQGRGESEPLSERGALQAKACGEFYKQTHFDKLFSSTSVRAVETAREIHAYHPTLPWQQIEQLHERSKGEAEGMLKNDFAAQYPEIEDAWERGEDPRVPGGESLEDVEKRVLPILEAHVAESVGETLIYVIHGNVIRTIVGAVLKSEYGLRGRIACDYCSATTLTFDHERKRFELVRVNETLVTL